MMRTFVSAYRRRLPAFPPTLRSTFTSSSDASSTCSRGGGGDLPSKPSSDTKVVAGKWWLSGPALMAWGTLLHLRDLEESVEEFVDVVEDTVELVEKVATATEKVSEFLEEKLPDGAIKVAVDAIGDVAENIVEETKVAQELLHEVDGVMEILEDLFTIQEREEKDLPGLQ